MRSPHGIKRNYDVDLDPETEAIVTIGSKEGLAHLSLAMIGPGDVVLTPTPTYPIHMYSFDHCRRRSPRDRAAAGQRFFR